MTPLNSMINCSELIIEKSENFLSNQSKLPFISKSFDKNES